MKKLTLTCMAAALLFAACNNEKTSAESTEASSKDSLSAATAEVKPAEATPPIDEKTMQKNWETYSTPGDIHKMMKSWDGTWDGEVSTWMTPGAPPEKGTAMAVNKMVLGDRYQQSHYTGTMMGAPFEGFGTYGYDNARKMFESTWMDNMGTGTIKLEGPWDEATKTVKLSGKMIDPSTLKETIMKEEFKVVDDNTQIISMFATGPDGKEFKTMEVKMTRKKK